MSAAADAIVRDVVLVSRAASEAARSGEWQALGRYDMIRRTLLAKLAQAGEEPRCMRAAFAAAHAASVEIEAAVAEGRTRLAADAQRIGHRRRVDRAYGAAAAA